MEQSVTLKEANELLKADKVLHKLGPDTITLRKLGKDRYALHHDEQQKTSILTGVETVNVLKQNTFYLK